MSFSIEYKTLFEVKLLHHYYLNKSDQTFDLMSKQDQDMLMNLYNISDFVEIAPSDSTASLLKGIHCIFKITQQGFQVYIQAKEVERTENNKIIKEYCPAIDLDNTLNLTFTIRFTYSVFSNYSIVPLSISKGEKYILANVTTDKPKIFPYLSQFASDYVANTAFSANDMLLDDKSNPAQVYIAKTVTKTKPPSNDWIDDTLVSGKPLHYLNENDLLTVYGNIFEYDTGNSGLLNLSITLKNSQNVSMNPPFKLQDADSSVVLVDLSCYSEGIYSLQLEDTNAGYSENINFFLLKSAPDKIDGIINISIKSDNSQYNILSDHGAINSVVFELRFKNRYTQWRFLGEKFTSAPVVGPYPLTKYGLTSVCAPDDSNTNVDDLPNPSVNMIKPEYDSIEKENYNLISEIYVH